MSVTHNGIFYCESDSYFYACDYGSRFLGCCSDADTDDVCGDGGTGCDGDDLRPAYFNTTSYDIMEDVTDSQCQEGYAWTVCPNWNFFDMDTSTNWSLFGCYSGDVCTDGGFPAQRVVGVATTPADQSDENPYPLDVDDGSPTSTILLTAFLPTRAPSTTSMLTTPLPSIAHASAASSSSSPLPPRTQHHTGAIAGGSIGGFAAIAAVLGLLLLYLRQRRHNSRQPKEMQSKEKPITEGRYPSIPQAIAHLID